MNLDEWPRYIRGAWRNPYKGYERGLQEIGKRLNYGVEFYDREWDVLIILDACRYDLFEEFAPRHQIYQQFDSVEPFYSCASSTKEWLRHTFDQGPDDLVSDTHYVTCTGFSEKLRQERLAGIDEVWRYAVDPSYGCTRPEAVTDAAIDAFRHSDASRLVVHYVQPHAPFLHCAGKYDSTGDGGKGGTQNVWRGLRAGKYDKEEVWEDYGQNLLTVLDEAHTVLRNVSGKVIVTSDHGNAMGEWGIYGHPEFAPLPIIKRVPWAEATGLGLNEYDVRGVEDISTGLGEHDLRDNLQALGYVE